MVDAKNGLRESQQNADDLELVVGHLQDLLRHRVRHDELNKGV